jgi:hypothetical protein
MCWDEWLEVYADDPRLEWALRELAKWVKDGDAAPECILKYSEKVEEKETSNE